MLWLVLAFIVFGVLLHNKGKKEDNSVMRVVGIILLVLGGVVFLIFLALIGWGLYGEFSH